MTFWSKPSGVDTGWTRPADLTVTSETDILLCEDGSELLQETENTILIEFWSGFRKIVSVINTIWQ